jgi:hypothetical protein
MKGGIGEERRPGVEALAKRLQEQHPKWPAWRCANEAKKQWTRDPAHRGQRGFFHFTKADFVVFLVSVGIVGWLVITALIWLGEHLHIWLEVA